MAGPQFLTPKSAAPSRPVRRFTLQQANKSLPLVKRIVQDIVRAHERALRIQEQLERNSSSKESTASQAELDRTMDRLQDFVDELSDIGVELKDYQTGLIDFVGRHQGRDVYLCWRLGEDQIGFWHELQAGVVGRKSVNTLEESD